MTLYWHLISFLAGVLVGAWISTGAMFLRKRKPAPVLHSNGDITYARVRYGRVDDVWFNVNTGLYVGDDVHAPNNRQLNALRALLSRPPEPPPAPAGAVSDAVEGVQGESKP